MGVVVVVVVVVVVGSSLPRRSSAPTQVAATFVSAAYMWSGSTAQLTAIEVEGAVPSRQEEVRRGERRRSRGIVHRPERGALRSRWAWRSCADRKSVV